jgi:hypothetical protein
MQSRSGRPVKESIVRSARRFAFIVFVVACLCSVPAVQGFTVPEQLRYDLTWTGIKVGEATLEARDYGSYLQLISTASSAKWASFFFNVEDAVISTLKKETRQNPYGDFIGVPHSYRMHLREGKYRRDKEYLFNRNTNKVTHINHLKKEALDFPFEGAVYDPLSCFYYLRTLPLIVGKSVYITIFDNKKSYPVEVQVLKKETLKLSSGVFNTIVVKPLMKSEGIFNRKGDMTIWLTDNDMRIPVMLMTKVSMGSVKAVLTGGQY